MGRERTKLAAGGSTGESKEIVTAYLIGYIPYESIVAVNRDGDEYYGHPHIFCHFEYSGQPYERLAFCERRELSYGQEYFTELENHDTVRLTSEKFGTAWAWRSSSSLGTGCVDWRTVTFGSSTRNTRLEKCLCFPMVTDQAIPLVSISTSVRH